MIGIEKKHLLPKCLCADPFSLYCVEIVLNGSLVLKRFHDMNGEDFCNLDVGQLSSKLFSYRSTLTLLCKL